MNLDAVNMGQASTSVELADARYALGLVLCNAQRAEVVRLTPRASAQDRAFALWAMGWMAARLRRDLEAV